MSAKWKTGLAGAAAGAVNGFFGAGGGMVLVPLLSRCLPRDRVFPGSLGIMLPVCLVSLVLTGGPLPWGPALPCLLGGFLGGLLSVRLHIKPLWLHRALGLLILLGGGRMLWN